MKTNTLILMMIKVYVICTFINTALMNMCSWTGGG